MSQPQSLRAAREEHRPGHALPRAFALDPAIYAYELESIWRRSWLYAGAGAQALDPGDFFSFQLGDDWILIVRGETGELHALHNSCRHRGTLICSSHSGRVRRWVCPYHQWSYGLDGSLLGSGGMDDELEGDDYGLHRAAVAELGGLVFVWPGPDPEPLGGAAAQLAAALAPHGLDRAKLAHQLDYEVAANWKLVWENNRECWHCTVGHPQYVQANFDAAPDTARVRSLASARAEDHARALMKAGGQDRSAPGAIDHPEPGLFRFPTPGRWWSCNRTPLAPGFVTESLDGAPVAPTMGDFRERDVGTLRIRTVPNFWAHASSDHAVLTRLVPAGPERTLVRIQWLVDRDAVEDRDYALEQLLPFWRRTSEQDWELCERNHAGVRSPAFTPGPYSRKREYNVIAFVQWYLDRLDASARAGGVPEDRQVGEPFDRRAVIGVDGATGKRRS